jgi:hypothetical protein
MPVSSTRLVARGVLGVVFAVGCACSHQLAAGTPKYEYRLLARTSRMVEEINQSAAEGFRVAFFAAGRTQSGNDLVAVMSRDLQQAGKSRFQYLVLSVGRASVGERAMNQAAAEGFHYRALALISYKYILMEKDLSAPAEASELKLLTTQRLSTMQHEIQAAAETGFRVEGVAGSGAVGIVAVLSRPKSANKPRYQYRFQDALPRLPDWSEDGFVFRWIVGGWTSTAYVTEKDLSSSPEKMWYETFTRADDLRSAQQAGFRTTGGGMLSTVGFTFVMARGQTVSGKWDHQFVEDGDYFSTGRTAHFEKQLTDWANQGYELADFSPMAAVMVKTIPDSPEGRSATEPSPQRLSDTASNAALTQPTSGTQVPSQPALSSVTHLAGLYRSGVISADPPSFHYLRFYCDGTVLMAGIVADSKPDTITKFEKMFQKPFKSSGTYEILGTTIQFSVQVLWNTIDYRGEIEGTALSLDSFNHTTGRRAHDAFHLVRPAKCE